jgi:adenylate cyclase
LPPALAKAQICQGCWQQMHVPIPIRGPLSLPFRVVGIKISQMHPNLCTICETMFTRVMRKKQMLIPATVLFADLRGYTELCEKAEGHAVADLLHGFYDECAAAVWEQDGIINKFVGDAVLAIFNFPMCRDDHVERAVQAGVDIQRRCAELGRVGSSPDASPMKVGVGIHTGRTSIGEVGTSYKDFTVVGPVVNMASRIQGAARSGEVLVSEDVYRLVEGSFPRAASREAALKGIEKPVKTYVLAA